MILLDVGGGNKPHVEAGYRTISTDRHDFSADFAELDAEFKQHDLLTPQPFEDNSIDKIWCHHVLEHLPHQLPNGEDALVFAVKEMARVLKPNCEMHLIVPWVEHTNAWRHPAHYRFFNYDIFHWFNASNPSPDLEAYGFPRNLKIIRNDIVDNCHIYAIFIKLDNGHS